MRTVIVLALCVVLNYGQENACFRQDYDYLGADIGMVSNIQTFGQCVQVCRNTEGCVAFTHQPSTQRCWPKNTEYGDDPGPLDGVNSQNMNCLKNDCYKQDFDFWGADLGMVSDIETFEACAEVCRNTDGCVAFTHWPETNDCWPKHTAFGEIPRPTEGVNSQNMDCYENNCFKRDFDFWGADLGMVSDVASFAQCLQVCRNTEGCVSFTHQPETNRCWPKSMRFGAIPRPKTGVNSRNLDCDGDDNGCYKADYDYWGADLGKVENVESFSDCLAICSETDNCKSIAYRASTNECWPKFREYGATPEDLEGVDSANLNCDPNSCFRKDFDFWGADLGMVSDVASFAQCLQVCRNTEGCVSFTHQPETNRCWPKHTRYGAIPRPKIGVNSRNLDCDGDDNGCYKANFDYWGADLGRVENVESFSDCLAICSETDGCVSIAYRASTNDCWPKNQENGERPEDLEGVDSANLNCNPNA